MNYLEAKGQSTKKKTIKISVEAKDIENGKRRNGESCPIALAIGRQLKNKNYFLSISSSGSSYLYSHNPFLTVTLFGLPDKAEKFIRKFDKKGRKTVKPISFELELPIECLADSNKSNKKFGTYKRTLP